MERVSSKEYCQPPPLDFFLGGWFLLGFHLEESIYLSG